MTTNAYTKNFVKTADRYGYTIIAIQEYFGKGLKVEVRPKNGDRYRYLPDLYEECRVVFSGDTPREERSWTIQTTSYGPLSREEIAEVMAGMRYASAFVTELESLNYDQLTPYLHPEIAARREQA